MQQEECLVISRTRRYVELVNKNGDICLGRALNSKLDTCVGDKVLVSQEGIDKVVTEIRERKNCLSRSYLGKQKQLIANLDLLIIVSAPEPAPNAVFIDRVLVASTNEGIAQTIAVNKSDLTDELARVQNIAKIYQELGYEISFLSAKSNLGVDELRMRLENPELEIVGLVGISGVGKSTMLNRLVPTADAKTRTVSEKSGQGKQTTTQAYGYIMPRKSAAMPLILVDLPGLQNFGVSHLSALEVRNAFLEFSSFERDCQYADCSHTVEPQCGVLNALREKQIAESRYASYLNILEELKASRPW